MKNYEKRRSFLPGHDRPGFYLHPHIGQIDPYAPAQGRWPRMFQQICLKLPEKAVHLIAHVKDVFPPGKIIPEEDDVLEGAAMLRNKTMAPKCCSDAAHKKTGRSFPRPRR